MHPESLIRSDNDEGGFGAPNDSYPAVVIIADGWTRAVFASLLAQGDLEGIREGLIEPGGLLHDVVSNIPSVSIASHASILTAKHQDEHWLPGHRWQESASAECHNYLSLAGPRNANRHLNPNVPTIFEGHPSVVSHAVQSVITRGADTVSRVLSMRSGPILRRAIELIRDSPRSVTVVWLPRGDAMAHIHGPDSRQARAEMVESSQQIGTFVRRLGKLGLLDTARIVLVPDHGQRPVCRTVDLGSIFEASGLETRVNPGRPGSAELVAMTSGDSAAHVYTKRPRSSEEIAERLFAGSPNGVELACWVESNVAFFRTRLGISSARWSGTQQVEYQVVQGEDPLAVGVDTGSISLDVSTPDVTGRFPDLVHQYMRSHVAGRSGQVLVMASEDSQFDAGLRIGYRFGKHLGTHGGPFASEVLVAAVHRGISDIEDVPVRSAELLRTLGLIAQTSREREQVGE